MHAGRTHAIGQALKQFEQLSDNRKQITLAGRIRSIRTHGKLTFGNLEDSTGTIQFLFRKDELGEKLFEQFSNLFDMGDFLEITGS